MSRRSWTDQDIESAVARSKSYRNVIKLLGLVPAGGNYSHVKNRINELNLDTRHFTGKGWSKDLKFGPKPRQPLSALLKSNSNVQSYKLKKRLFAEGYKKPRCEECGWAKKSSDGRIPVELDHINGNRNDNRLQNLRILCPNCHSLKPTHRGKNKKLKQ